LLFTGRATAAHSNAAVCRFNEEGETPNAQRPTPNVEFQKTFRRCLFSAFDIGCSALGVGRFLPPALSSLRPVTPGAYVTNLMRFDLRKAGAWFAIVSLIFWCSCERHRVGELPDEHATMETKGTTEEHDSRSDQPTSTTNTSHTAQTPEPRNSPPNFFPDKPKP
jgi:hypothetical protein